VTDAHADALRLAEDSQARGDMTGWLDTVYASASGDTSRVPWAHLAPNPNLLPWLDARPSHGGRALVVGCGLGDDAEELARRGYDVTAFDVSPAAVSWASSRHPASSVTYVCADLLHAPSEWAGAFDLVVEIYTVQVLRGEPRREALLALPGFVAPGGTLLLIARGREPEEPEGDLPWPLTKRELSTVAQLGMTTVAFEDFADDEGHRRFRVEWTRPAKGVATIDVE
jgi:SAM-dependent methyltransferase